MSREDDRQKILDSLAARTGEWLSIADIKPRAMTADIALLRVGELIDAGMVEKREEKARGKTVRLYRKRTNSILRMAWRRRTNAQLGIEA